MPFSELASHNVSIAKTELCLRIIVMTPGFVMLNEPVHDISNNVTCATSKASDQPAHTCSLIRAFASRLSIQ